MQLPIIQKRIYEVRGVKVMFVPIAIGIDLAELYEVETRILNQAVKRNIDIFPDGFMFRITQEEWKNMSSHFVMTYPSKRPKASLPLAFTEHGVAMLSNILKSKKARQTSIAIVRAFINLKQFVLNYEGLSNKLKEIESKYNKQFKDVYEAINYLLQKDKQQTEQKERKHIGFK